MIRLTKPEPDGTPSDWDRDSFAVVACDDAGNGCVLWTIGPHVEHEIREGGLRQLCDLGLDNAPHGVSIWVGKYIARVVDTGDYGKDYEFDPVGSFREPTEVEWVAIREGRCPWTENDRR
jgi:hypothetical protein